MSELVGDVDGGKSKFLEDYISSKCFEPALKSIAGYTTKERPPHVDKVPPDPPPLNSPQRIGSWDVDVGDEVVGSWEDDEVAPDLAALATVPPAVQVPSKPIKKSQRQKSKSSVSQSDLKEPQNANQVLDFAETQNPNTDQTATCPSGPASAPECPPQIQQLSATFPPCQDVVSVDGRDLPSSDTLLRPHTSAYLPFSRTNAGSQLADARGSTAPSYPAPLTLGQSRHVCAGSSDVVSPTRKKPLPGLQGVGVSGFNPFLGRERLHEVELLEESMSKPFFRSGVRTPNIQDSQPPSPSTRGSPVSSKAAAIGAAAARQRKPHWLNRSENTGGRGGEFPASSPNIHLKREMRETWENLTAQVAMGCMTRESAIALMKELLGSNVNSDWSKTFMTWQEASVENKMSVPREILQNGRPPPRPRTSTDEADHVTYSYHHASDSWTAAWVQSCKKSVKDGVDSLRRHSFDGEVVWKSSIAAIDEQAHTHAVSQANCPSHIHTRAAAATSPGDPHSEDASVFAGPVSYARRPASGASTQSLQSTLYKRQLPAAVDLGKFATLQSGRTSEEASEGKGCSGSSTPTYVLFPRSVDRCSDHTMAVRIDPDGGTPIESPSLLHSHSQIVATHSTSSQRTWPAFAPKADAENCDQPWDPKQYAKTQQKPDNQKKQYLELPRRGWRSTPLHVTKRKGQRPKIPSNILPVPGPHSNLDTPLTTLQIKDASVHSDSQDTIATTYNHVPHDPVSIYHPMTGIEPTEHSQQVLWVPPPENELFPPELVDSQSLIRSKEELARERKERQATMWELYSASGVDPSLVASASTAVSSISKAATNAIADWNPVTMIQPGMRNARRVLGVKSDPTPTIENVVAQRGTASGGSIFSGMPANPHQPRRHRRHNHQDEPHARPHTDTHPPPADAVCVTNGVTDVHPQTHQYRTGRAHGAPLPFKKSRPQPTQGIGKFSKNKISNGGEDQFTVSIGGNGNASVGFGTEGVGSDDGRRGQGNAPESGELAADFSSQTQQRCPRHISHSGSREMTVLARDTANRSNGSVQAGAHAIREMRARTAPLPCTRPQPLRPTTNILRGGNHRGPRSPPLTTGVLASHAAAAAAAATTTTTTTNVASATNTPAQSPENTVGSLQVTRNEQIEAPHKRLIPPDNSSIARDRRYQLVSPDRQVPTSGGFFFAAWPFPVASGCKRG
eukprot:Rmarinus@m.28149